MPYRYSLPPIVGIEIYKNDAVVVRGPGRASSVEHTRSEVKEFSKASRQRLAFVAANSDVVFTSMITLTYPREFPNDGSRVKRDLRAFLKALRRRTSDLDFLWFLEFQRRGAPHIHILVRGARVHKPMQHWVSKTWYRICGTGDLRHLAAGTRLERIRKPNGARNYAVKYAHKMKQKAVPPDYRNVGRFWGCTRGVKPKVKGSFACSNDDLVGALEAGGWLWQNGDVIRYHTLYGASEALTNWVPGSILVLSTSQLCHSRMTPMPKEDYRGYETVRNDGRRIWADYNACVRHGG